MSQPITTIDELTDSQIHALRREAIQAGDLEMAHTCYVASGSEETATASQITAAKRIVVEAINDAAAQEEES